MKPVPFSLCAFAITSTLASTAGWAQTASTSSYPVRPVRFVVGFAPGGPYRISGEALPHADTNAIAHALIAANPARVLWGSDWPHVMVKSTMPNDGDLCDLLSAWIPDAALREQVLVTNPAKLYGF